VQLSKDPEKTLNHNFLCPSGKCNKQQIALFIHIGSLCPYFSFQNFTQIHIYLLLEFCNSTTPLDSTQEIYFEVLFLPSLKSGRPGKQEDLTGSL